MKTENMQEVSIRAVGGRLIFHKAHLIRWFLALIVKMLGTLKHIHTCYKIKT